MTDFARSPASLLLGLCLLALPACQETTTQDAEAPPDTAAAVPADTAAPNTRDTAAAMRDTARSASPAADTAGSGGVSPERGSGPRTVPQNRYTTTDSGLKYYDLRQGDGPVPEDGDTVRVHYTGWLQQSGEKFDSSRDRGQPFSFALGQGRVIEGWDEGVATMNVGTVRQLVIPPDLAYGQRQRGPIPPNSTLVFEVELLGIEGQ